MRHAFVKCLITIFLTAVAIHGFSQPGTTIELTKPKQYQNRMLASEKTEQRKFKLGRHIYQNMVTHYNYYFNANTRLNAIVDRAKLAFKEDYTQLLPFYNYSLDVTARDGDMDSILYKCNAGILLHDLRSDWVDNMYLLMGKAYYYRKNFDSAFYVFQYINYAFAPKDEGYDIPIGSNASNNDGIFTVATKEDRDLWKKLTSLPPSRNDALLWEAKDYTEAGKYSEAAGLLEILRSDPLFPARLQTDLHETISYWYYKQKIYDSAASHLSKAVSNTADRQEKARREFLTAQLYLLSNNNEEAIAWYNKAAEHSLDPVLEVYANLNSISAYTNKSADLLQQKIDNLTKLAHKDKYVANRDIIYYAIAQIELQKNDKPAAKKALQKSITSSVNDPVQKNRSFLLLADIDYDSKDYIAANNFYDSISVSYFTNNDDKIRVQQRMAALKIITQDLADIHREDSLQAIAIMPKAEQDAIIKKVLKQLRKLQGLKEEELNNSNNNNINPAVRGQTPAASDLFASSNTSTDWYFNNNSLKTSGYNSFRLQWGTRPNVDNWRRQADVDKAAAANSRKAQAKADSAANAQAKANGTNSMSYDALYNNLPVTPEKLKASNDKIAKALFTNGQTFQNTLEDYPSAIDAYDTLNLKFADNNYEEEALFNLYYCFKKLGRMSSADSVKALMAKKFANGKWNNLLQKGPAPTVKTTDPATQKYEDIYNLFIEGEFEKAKNEKARADSMYGNSHWTPQLLFIEAIYYVSKREDSIAINRLNNLAKLYPSSPMAARANTMVTVLRRRSEIESYLTSLQITRYKDDEIIPLVTTQPMEAIVNKPNLKPDSVVAKPVTQQANKVTADTARSAITTAKTFQFNAADSQYVVILLDKVDPVFANEAGNAFNRYNSSTYFNQHLKSYSLKLDDRYNLVMVGPFKDAATALDYVDKTRPIAPSRILPWLTADKFTFSIISGANLDVLRQTKDLDSYKKLLQTVMPGKF